MFRLSIVRHKFLKERHVGCGYCFKFTGISVVCHKCIRISEARYKLVQDFSGTPQM